MRNFSLILSFLLFTFLLNGQCPECPAGSTVLTGSTNITDQNNAIDYCITGSWTGTITNIGTGSTVTICPTAEWTLSSDLTLQQNIVIDNYGSITDNGAGSKLLIQGGVELNNQAGGDISITDFENADADFVNAGTLAAENIYLHGDTSNSGTITSTADCGGNATPSCGFYLGNKNTPFNNTGTVNTVDANLSEDIIGGGVFNSTGNLDINNNGGLTDNVFFVNDLELLSGQPVNTGTFEIMGVLDCDNAHLFATTCFTETGSLGTACANPEFEFILCDPISLPLDIIDFQVKQSGDKLVFNWEVASEINVSHYEILSSVDGKNFDLYTETSASNDQYYQTSERALKADIAYFKLKSVDLNGLESYHSEILSIYAENEVSYSIAPNPVSSTESLKITFEQEQTAIVTVYSLDGQQIKMKHYPNQSSIDLTLEEIEISGLYIVKILTDNKIYTEEIFIR